MSLGRGVLAIPSFGLIAADIRENYTSCCTISVAQYNGGLFLARVAVQYGISE